VTIAAKSRGFLLAIEGIDGAGKTTQVRCLEGLLGAAQIPFVSTKEPTSGPWGRKIRESAQKGRMAPAEELAAFLNDRHEHVEKVVHPALGANKVVLIDRYYLSTVAYQGARGMSPAHLLQLNAFAPRPDILIVLDVAPDVGLRRVRERGDAADLFEREDELARARAIFQSLDVENLRIIDGNRERKDIAKEIAGLLFGALGLATPVVGEEFFRSAGPNGQA
jgi:dTMP kinase